MGKVFWILVWDDYGCGLDLVNPRILTIYDGSSLRMHNSFSYETEEDIENFLEQHRIPQKYGHYYRIIR